MFKKFSHIILSVLLLVSTMGLAISKHYCGGSLISTSFFHEAESCCGDSDCCQNEPNFYQVDDDFSLASISEIPLVTEVDLMGFTFILKTVNENLVDEEQKFLVAETPPPTRIQITLSKKQVYLL